MKVRKLGTAFAAVELALAVKAMWDRIPEEDREAHIKTFKNVLGAGKSFVASKAGGKVSQVKEFVADKNLSKGEYRAKQEAKSTTVTSESRGESTEVKVEKATTSVDSEIVDDAFNVVSKNAEDEEIVVEVTKN